MRNFTLLLLLFFLFHAYLRESEMDGLCVWAAEPAAEGSATVRKTKANLHFNVPPDWPIEERGGVVAPIPVEEYLHQKFQALEARYRVVEQQLNGLELRIRLLEESSKKAPRTLQSPPPAPVQAPGSQQTSEPVSN